MNGHREQDKTFLRRYLRILASERVYDAMTDRIEEYHRRFGYDDWIDRFEFTHREHISPQEVREEII